MATLSSDVVADRVFYCPQRSSVETNKQMKRHEIYKGTLFLKNRVKKKWKERFVVLYNDRTLSYWANESDFEHNKPAKSCIDLSLTQNIETVDKNHGNNDRNLVKSPSDSLSRKGSMDFSRIFSHKTKRNKNNMEDNDHSHSHTECTVTDDDDIDVNENRFIFKIIQTQKSYTYTFCIFNNHKLFAQWIKKFEFAIFGNILYKGYLFQLSRRDKKQKLIKQKEKQKQKWMKRWFIIYDRKELRYFNNASKQTALGIVILSNLTSMSKSEDYKAKKKYGQLLYLIKLQFEKTIIILASLNSKERDEWYDQICYVLTHKQKPQKSPKSLQNMSLLKVPINGKQANRSQSATITANARTKSKAKHTKKEIEAVITPSISISPSSTSMRSSCCTTNNIHVHNMDDIDDIYRTVHQLQNEMLYLKVQTATNGDGKQQHKCEDDVDNELLDVDQYLILDKDWRNWSYLEIVEWITNLEYGRYHKYKMILFKNMKFREMKGIFLPKIDKIDLSHFFGITHFGDASDLYKQIRRLIKT